jgi:hypothetical protein
MSSAVILNAAHFTPNSADYGQERIMIKRIAATLLIAAFGLSSTACIGRFATSGLVRKFNLTVVQDKWPHEIVFLLLYIIPVYPLAGLIDMIIVNSIEFWTGTNPIDGGPRVAGASVASHQPGDTHYAVAADGSEAISTLREDGSIDFEIRAADGSTHFVNVVREDGQLVARDADGQRVALVDSMTGEVRDIDQTGNL